MRKLLLIGLLSLLFDCFAIDIFCEYDQGYTLIVISNGEFEKVSLKPGELLHLEKDGVIILRDGSVTKVLGSEKTVTIKDLKHRATVQILD